MPVMSSATVSCIAIDIDIVVMCLWCRMHFIVPHSKPCSGLACVACSCYWLQSYWYAA